MGFEWLKDVRGDGACYYRSVICGYLEMILSENPKFIEDLIKT